MADILSPRSRSKSKAKGSSEKPRVPKKPSKPKSTKESAPAKKAEPKKTVLGDGTLRVLLVGPGSPLGTQLVAELEKKKASVFFVDTAQSSAHSGSSQQVGSVIKNTTRISEWKYVLGLPHSSLYSTYKRHQGK
jgi:hypothetical protein